MADKTLLIPIEVKALVVNDKVRSSQNFQRWSMDYQSLESYVSPEPPAFSGNDNDFAENPQSNGVYLHWTLPEALRKGDHNTTSGSTTFPLVPNRWLVVRYSGKADGRIATAWVVESDFLDPNEGTVPYINPFAPAGGLQVTSLGRKLNLNHPQWQETGSNALFLTAVGPGNLTFSAYQPSVENVFSIHDPLTKISESDTLSYFVAGWYSRVDADILSTWGTSNNFQNWLSSLKWSVKGDASETARTSLYHGMVYGINWQKNGEIPPSAYPADSTNIRLAVGNTSVDALTAMIDALVEQQQQGNVLNSELLEAFQYDLLQVLDQPGGEEILQQRIHEAWFNGFPGGYSWEIIDKPIDTAVQKASNEALSAEELAQEEQWLAALNQAQATYDNAVRLLQEAQWLLYALWWKQGNAQQLSDYPTDLLPTQFQQQLDPQNQNGLLYNVFQQIQALNALSQQLPNGQTQEELAKSIDHYAQAHNLPNTRELKRSILPKFWQANEPVVLISGMNASTLLTNDQALFCRFPEQVVTGFTYQGRPITSDSLQGGIPTVEMTNLPAVISALLNEFFFLDPNNANLIVTRALQTSNPDTISTVSALLVAHSAYLGQLPAIDLNAWVQPWVPLFLLWEVNYYPIAHDTNETDNWSFDGTQYSWTGNGAAAQAIVLSGRIFLTPQCQFNFQSKLKTYLANNPNANLKALEDFITKVQGWDLLSQSLSGFSQQLIMRDPRSNRSPDNNTILYQPDVTLAKLVGKEADYAPVPGDFEKPPFQDWPPSTFQQYRSGQFYFQRLMVVDRFGQSIEVVNSTTSEQFKPIIADGFLPDKTVMPQEPYRFVQLPPRLLQPGRLNFDYVSSVDDSKVIDLDAGVNLICAWVLPNHLDGALSFYDNQGVAIGEMRVITDDQQQQILFWESAPNSAYTTLQEVMATFLHLGQFLIALSNKGPQAFDNLLQVVDETLWTIDPLGVRRDQSLTVLVGRPLALVRSRLQFQLDGPPVADPSWRYTFSALAPNFPNYAFPIQLGRLNFSQDGLLGYFFGTNYDQFNAVYYPQQGEITPTHPPYIVPIGNGNYINLPFDGSSAAYITMLMDPRASVHAITDILPVTVLDLPMKFVTGALKALDIFFHIGPLLSDTHVRANQTDPDNATIIMPKPSEKNGTWSWLEYSEGNWKQYDIAQSDQLVKFSNIPARFRTGFLKLSSSVQKNT